MATELKKHQPGGCPASRQGHSGDERQRASSQQLRRDAESGRKGEDTRKGSARPQPLSGPVRQQGGAQETNIPVRQQRGAQETATDLVDHPDVQLLDVRHVHVRPRRGWEGETQVVDQHGGHAGEQRLHLQGRSGARLQLFRPQATPLEGPSQTPPGQGSGVANRENPNPSDDLPTPRKSPRCQQAMGLE